MQDWVIKKDHMRAAKKYPDLQIFRNSFLAMLEKEGAHPHPTQKLLQYTAWVQFDVTNLKPGS
jgi:hypothetical protein